MRSLHTCRFFFPDKDENLFINRLKLAFCLYTHHPLSSCMEQFTEGFKLDDSNREFMYAADFVTHTSSLLYLTGKAGTGKTTFLKYLKSTIDKNMVVLAPTGVAAVNAGGQTIHSFFNIKPSVYVPGDKRLRTWVPPEDPDKSVINDHFRYNRDKLEIIRGLELLVIDEISMVRCDLLDVVDRLLRVFRRRESSPFGGVQVVLIGDTFQLPPIVNQEDWSILGNFYRSPFFFSSRIMQASKPVYIELKKVYRQKDSDFIGLLNRVRVNRLDAGDLSLLNSRYLHGFSPDREEDYIILATHNRMVEETNERRLREIDEPLFRFEAVVEGVFPENSYPADNILKLKKDAQVMFLRNDRNKRYYNGKIGHILDISEDGLFVELPEGDIIEVEPEEWANIRYSWDSRESKVVEETVGTFVQYPLKLAWAITVHKSQGLTFEKIIADLEEAFAPGQVYVALSRCTSFSGLLLKTPLNARTIMTDSAVLEFAGNETPQTLLLNELESGKTTNYLRRALNAYLSREYQKSAEMVRKAVGNGEGESTRRALLLAELAARRIVRQAETMLQLSLPETASKANTRTSKESGVATSAVRKEIRSHLKSLAIHESALTAFSRLMGDLSAEYPGNHSLADVAEAMDRLAEKMNERMRALLKGNKKAAGNKK